MIQSNKRILGLFRIRCVCFGFSLFLLSHVAEGQTPPNGWKSLKTESGTAFSPRELKEGTYLRATFLPLQKMNGAPLMQFLDTFADDDIRQNGQPIGKANQAVANSEHVANTIRQVQTKTRKLTAMYVGVTFDRENARILRTTFSDESLLKEHQEGIKDCVKQLSEIEKKDAIASGRGVDMDQVPTTPKGMKPGGKITPGIYAGNRLDNEGRIMGRFRLYLFENMECLILNEQGELIDENSSKVTFSYSPATGKLNISSYFDFWNDQSDPDEQYCLYGTDTNGKKYIHAYEYFGVNSYHTKLYLAGPVDKFSPSEEQALEEKSRKELARYKFVVKPGDGLKSEDVEGFFHDVRYEVGFNGNSTENSVYLVLKDGTIRDGLPVSYDELDVSLSRRRERELWGKWEKEGERIKAAWPDRPDRFELVKGNWALQANRNEILKGTFSTGSTHGNFVTGSSWNIWGVTFSEGNRWERFSRGGSDNGSLAQSNGAFIFSSYDDDGSVVSANTSDVVFSSVRKQKKGSNRIGTYQIEGWTIVLTAENGEVTRLPFFFTSSDRKSIFFDGSSLSLDEVKELKEKKQTK